MIVKNIFLTTLLFLLVPIIGFAQTYPVQISTVIIPPYSLHLSDYTTSDKLAVNILFNDPIRFELGVKLKITIEGRGITIRTKQEFNPPPFFLQSGFPERLTSVDLAPYFDARNLDFLGIDRRAFERNGALPEGVYRICIEAWEYSQNKKVSNTGCSTVWMMLNDPPIINYPKNNEKIKIQEPQLVVFNWTPRHMGSPNSAFATEYDFELVEVRSTNQDPNNAMLSSPPIYTATTQSTSLVYSIAETPLIPGQKYAFRVRAKAIAGLDEFDLFKNNGYSEVFSFVYGDHCLTPDEIVLESINPTSIKASWISLPIHTSFIVRYKEKKEGAEWFEKTSMIAESTIGSLRPETEYLIQVIGYCGVVGNEEIKTYTVKTKKVEPNKFMCGATEAPVDMGEPTLIKKLSPGDFIESSNFKIALVEVSNNGDSFSGRGVAYIPWLKLAGLKVDFKDIQVNEKKKVIKGNISSVKSANSNLVWTPKTPNPETPTDGSEGTETGDNGSGTVVGSTNEGTVIIIKTDNPNITVNESGATVITDDKGKVTVVQPGDTVTLVDSNGNESVVVGGSNVATSSGTNNTNGTGGNSSSGNVQALSDESIQILKSAIERVKKETDFSMLTTLEEDLLVASYNLKGSLEMERDALLRKSSSSQSVSSSQYIISIEEALISKHEDTPWGPSKFNAYKEVEKKYNLLKILDVICKKELDVKELNLLANRLKVGGKLMTIYISESKVKKTSDEEVVEAIALSIVKLAESQLLKKDNN